MAHDGRELELKLAVDPASVRRLKAHLKGLLQGRYPVSVSLDSVYFDTPEHTLRANALALRLRRTGSGYVQTIKAGEGRPIGIFDRSEWEQPAAGYSAEHLLIKDTPVERVLGKQRLGSLRPVFQTRVRRTSYRLSRDGSPVEASLDEGYVEAGRQRCRLCELELEWAGKHSHGATGKLFALAKRLDRIVPMRLCLKDKAERGYELIERQVATGVPLAPIALGRDTSNEEAFRIISRACLGEVIRNEPGMLAGDGEALHQMRVALRRLRAAIGMFRQMVSDRQCLRIKAGLRWIMGELGAARDLDVFMAEVLTPLRHRHAKDPGFLRTRRDFERDRRKAHEHAAIAVKSRRYRLLILETAEWIENGSWTRRGDHKSRRRRAKSVERYAVRKLERSWRKLKRGCNRLSDRSALERHRLRIRAKKLRYAVEFFRGLFPRPRSTRRCTTIVRRLKHLQDALGALNDVVARESLASRFALSLRRVRPVSDSVARAFSAGLIFGEEDARMAELLDTAESAYRDLLKVEPFWK